MADIPPAKPRRSARRWIAWGVLLLACASLVTADTLVNLNKVSQQRAWQAACLAHAQQTTAARRLLAARITPAQGQSIEALRESWRLDAMPKVAVGTTSVRYRIPGETFDARAKGFNTTMYFENGQFTAFSITPPPRPPTPVFTLKVYFDWMLLVVAVVAVGAWLTFILAAFYERSRMTGFGEAALGAIVLAAAPAIVWESRRGPGGLWMSVIVQSLWLTMVFLSIVVIIKGVQRRRREDESHCAKCLYDLTGNESGVCPECGTPTAAGLRRKRSAEAQVVAGALEGAAGASQGDPEHVAALK